MSVVLYFPSICHSILCTLASRSKQTTNLVKKIHEYLGFIVSELVAGSCEQDNHFNQLTLIGMRGILLSPCPYWIKFC